MNSLTIFCVGTGHTAEERWTITRALYDLTAATPIERDDLLTATTAPDDGKVIFDGPSLFFSSNETLNDNCDLAVRYIDEHHPETVCLVGHSRGAVLCAMIAARSYLPPIGRTTPRFRLWLLDIVTHTHALGGLPVISNEIALTAYPNVKEIVRVVMEDEFNPPAMFPLEEFCISDGRTRVPDHADDRSIVDVSFLRMPGGHGSGTQVNPVAKDGESLPIGNIHTRRPGTLWPIGEACLIEALDDLHGWGVPLTGTADQFRGDQRLLDAYSRIRLLNARRPDGKILLNDVGSSKAGELQESAFRRTERDTTKLDAYGTDFMSNELIVNDGHLGLIRDLTSTSRTLANRMAAAGDGLDEQGRPASDRSLAGGSSPDLDRLWADIGVLRGRQPSAYGTLVHLGYALGGSRVGAP